MSLFTKKAYVGLDIGHHTLRAVQVERTASGWRVAKYGSAPTPEDTVRDGVVIDVPILGLAIKNMLKSAHIGATSASIAISGGTVVVRPIRLPKMAESALRKSIRFEASRYVPNSVEDSYIEFEIIGDVDATNMDVIIAAAPKELVDSRVSACEAAGLDVENVEVATFAAYRSIIEADHGRDWSDKTLGLVDIGSSVTNLGVISNGGFSMTRAIPAGGQVLTDALKSYFKLSDEDAENGKGQLDVRGLLSEASVAENPPLRILHTHIDDLVREVRRSINYWQSQQNEASTAKHVDVIVLCGGGAKLPGLAEYFQHKLGIETVAQGVYDNPRFLPGQSEDSHGLDMAVAVGLAMGLAPTHAVVRDPKPVAETPAKAAKPPKPPKEPKPTKPPKGRKFSVTVPVEAPPGEPEVSKSSEEVEIAAFLPAAPSEPESIEETPLVAELTNPEPIAAEIEFAEATELPAHSIEIEAPAPITAEVGPEPAAVEEKYGPELAALIGAFESEPVIATAASESDAKHEVSASPDEFAQPLSASQRMASRTTAPHIPLEAVETPTAETPVAESTIAEMPVAELPPTEIPIESSITEMPEVAVLADAPVAEIDAPETTVAEPISELPTVVAPAAAFSAPSTDFEAPDAPATRSALLDEPVASTINGPAKLPRDKKVKKPLFSLGRRSSKPVKDVARPKPAKAEKPEKEVKAKRPLFSLGKKAAKPVQDVATPKPVKAEKPAKPEKVVKPRKESKATKSNDVRSKQHDERAATTAEGTESGSAIKKAASWLFGNPVHEKPSGALSTNSVPAKAKVRPEMVASRNAEIELLRGSSLEPVDQTLIGAKPQSPDPRPDFNADISLESNQGQETETTKAQEPHMPNTETDSEQEAA